jgi:predicted DNA-binding transcriptional regulator AlpA
MTIHHKSSTDWNSSTERSQLPPFAHFKTTSKSASAAGKPTAKRVASPKGAIRGGGGPAPGTAPRNLDHGDDVIVASNAIGQAVAELMMIREKRLLELVPFSRSTLHRKICEGSFPAGELLGPRIRAWLLRDVMRWLEGQRSAQPW